MRPRSHPPEATFPPGRLPRRLAANQALATRENQGNLAPIKDGGRFLPGGGKDACAGTAAEDLRLWREDVGNPATACQDPFIAPLERVDAT